MFTAIMYAVIAPVADQSAIRKPTIVITTPDDGFWSRRSRLSLRSFVVSGGTIPLRWFRNDVIVSGLATSVNSPRRTSSADGIAMNDAYASADARSVALSAMNPLKARMKIAL
jgi:hypothetical protein